MLIPQLSVIAPDCITLSIHSESWAATDSETLTRGTMLPAGWSINQTRIPGLRLGVCDTLLCRETATSDCSPSSAATAARN